MAIKYLSFVFFWVLVCIYPVHQVYGGEGLKKKHGGSKGNSTILQQKDPLDHKPDGYDLDFSPDYLWIYVVFAYVFSAAAIYLIITETNHVIRVRQKYLSTHSTVTDRTIRLSGIPPDLRTEEKIKETVEDLQIGKVESVTLCRDWQELDDLIDERMVALRRLEEAWTVHLGCRRRELMLESPRRFTMPQEQAEDEELGEGNPWNETDELLPANGNGNGRSQGPVIARAHPMKRPMTRIWFGPLNLKSRKIDAIDYYEETLRRLDENIKTARQKEFNPTPLAFVTLDSIAACQMAIQAIIDPGPMQLIANPAPAPDDVIWRNTYLSRRRRMTKAWLITLFVLLLTVVWWAIFIPVAGLLNLETIGKVSPQLRDFLCQHESLSALVKTTLPTLILSLMLVLVPYLYDWLSRYQGMTSQGDEEMSVISKNFFFTFFNLFVSFTLFGTASNAYTSRFWDTLQKFGPVVLAKALANLSSFYTNLIVLQAIGLSPFRLLEFGAVSLYPIGLMGSKTPRGRSSLPLCFLHSKANTSCRLC